MGVRSIIQIWVCSEGDKSLECRFLPCPHQFFLLDQEILHSSSWQDASLLRLVVFLVIFLQMSIVNSTMVSEWQQVVMLLQWLLIWIKLFLLDYNHCYLKRRECQIMLVMALFHKWVGMKQAVNLSGPSVYLDNLIFLWFPAAKLWGGTLALDSIYFLQHAIFFIYYLDYKSSSWCVSLQEEKKKDTTQWPETCYESRLYLESRCEWQTAPQTAKFKGTDRFQLQGQLAIFHSMYCQV